MMDRMLKNLKENMDNTVLKDLDFKEVNKSKVRKVIYNSKKTKSIRSLFPRILTLSLACIFLVGISYFGIQQIGLIQKDTQFANQKNTNKEDKSNNELNQHSTITPPQQEENYDNMEKEDVLNKILNTVDNFQSASGKFETYDRFYDNSTSNVNVEYKVSLNNEIGGYEKIINMPDKNITGDKIKTSEIFYNNRTIWNIDNDRMTYYTNTYEIEPRREFVKSKDVFLIPINKIYDSEDKFRERPPIGISGLSLFPYEMVAKYLRFNNHWDIEKQNEKLLGHNTIILYGKIDKSIIDNMQPGKKSFRFWVDKDTGILLKYEIYNENGEILSYLHPKNLSVNVVIDSKEFSPNLDNYKPMQVLGNQYKDSREKDIEVIEHADTNVEEVEAVLNTLRIKLPFLYEFSSSDLKIFSASMERYNEYYQAYLTYSYKKEGNKLGSGSRLIYVRIYHKDSIVSSLGDFNTEKGKKLDAFTLNGIKWDVFQIKNQPNAHFIGSAGNYRYELVTQEISIEDVKSLLKSFKKSKL